MTTPHLPSRAARQPMRADQHRRMHDQATADALLWSRVCGGGVVVGQHANTDVPSRLSECHDTP